MSQENNNTNNNTNNERDCPVRVAVRIRPQNPRDIIDMCRVCTAVTPNEPQIILGMDKAFTFDHVYDINAKQLDIYDGCVQQLVEAALSGFNATVLAYGQTGSGKTYTMGTGFNYELNDQQQGIIPRAIFHMFTRIEDLKSSNNKNDCDNSKNMDFSVAVQFIELYNEDIFDLLEPHPTGKLFKIHENELGQILVSGATIKAVNNPVEAIRCLQQGALARTTASTQMNDQSSRSHALFTILIRRQRIVLKEEGNTNDFETLTSKFHFVDLAGSERLKRTGATGERARESISINCGLLALGNCISALGDKSRKATHIPYRDSKLTRLLQDSLGGNSQTLMIACISPSDRDFMETLNTLKYANRARNIKNKIQINMDQSSKTIAQLRGEIASLQLELLELKQGKRIVDIKGNTSISDTFHENEMLILENKRLQQRIKTMNETINALTERNTQLQLEKEMNNWSTLTEAATEIETDQTLKNLIQGYLNEIEKLQAKLIESEEMYQQMKSQYGMQSRFKFQYCPCQDTENFIQRAKKEVERDKETILAQTSCDKDFVYSDESDHELSGKSNDIQDDLEDLNNDIEIKSRLIQQLELSQQRMQLMKHQYEDKLMLLSSKITNTQKERDEVLLYLGSNGNNNKVDTKIKNVKEEYETKINNMEREIKKLQQAQREHNNQRQEIMAQETKLKNLRAQLMQLKSSKAQLIRKLAEQSHKYRQEETKKNREIAKLRKEQRKQENTVRSLQAKVQAKENILKRKTEEVTSLRRSQRTLKKRGYFGNNFNYNSRLAWQRWYNISRTLDRVARNKLMIQQFEHELERLINERHLLLQNLSTIIEQNNEGYSDDVPNIINGNELDNERDLIKTNLKYIEKSIDNAQQAIMQFEDNKSVCNVDTSQNLQTMINGIDNIEEAKYLLEKLSNNVIDLLCKVLNGENCLHEQKTLLKETQQENIVQQQLLQHFMAQSTSEKINDLFESLSKNVTKISTDLSNSEKSLQSNETYDIQSTDSLVDRNNNSSVDQETNTKIRCRTTQPHNLLFGERVLL